MEKVCFRSLLFINSHVVPVAWKGHEKWFFFFFKLFCFSFCFFLFFRFLFSRPGIVMEFVKSDESHGKGMDFSNADFDYQNTLNVYPPTSPFLLYLVQFLDYLVMNLHDLVMEKSWNFIEL